MKSVRSRYKQSLSKPKNVKLRPAAQGHKEQVNIDLTKDEDDDDEEFSKAGTEDSLPKIVSTTNLPVDGKHSRHNLSQIGQELNITVTGDLLLDSAVLLVGTTDSAPWCSIKLDMALKHRIPLVSPEFLNSIHAKWLAGESISLEREIDTFRLSPLFGVLISSTGFQEGSEKAAIKESIESQDGVFSTKLTSRTNVLLVPNHYTPSTVKTPSEKIQMASMKGIPIVHQNFLLDLVNHGGLSTELLNKWKWDRVQEAKVDTESSNVTETPARKQKNQEDKPVILSKRRKGVRTSERHELDELLGSVRASQSQSFLEEPSTVSTNPILSQKISVISTLNKQRESMNVPAPPSQPLVGAQLQDEEAIFEGKSFFVKLNDATERSVVINALTSRGGNIVQSPTFDPKEVDYVIIDIFWSPTRFVYSTEFEDRVVTMVWVEWCIYMQACVPPENRFLERPLDFSSTIKDAGNMKVSSSGLLEIYTVHLSRFLSRIGTSLEVTLTKATTYLIHADAEIVPVAELEGKKAEKARLWGINIVGLETFVDDCRRMSREYCMRNVVGCWSSTQKDTRALTKLIHEMGGSVLSKPSHIVTHFFHQQSGKQAIKELKEFPNIRVVHPQWIRACHGASFQVLEDDYPATFDSSKGPQLLGLVSSQTAPSSSFDSISPVKDLLTEVTFAEPSPRPKTFEMAPPALPQSKSTTSLSTSRELKRATSSITEDLNGKEDARFSSKRRRTGRSLGSSRKSLSAENALARKSEFEHEDEYEYEEEESLQIRFEDRRANEARRALLKEIGNDF